MDRLLEIAAQLLASNATGYDKLTNGEAEKILGKTYRGHPTNDGEGWRKRQNKLRSILALEKAKALIDEFEIQTSDIAAPKFYLYDSDGTELEVVENLGNKSVVRFHSPDGTITKRIIDNAALQITLDNSPIRKRK